MKPLLGIDFGRARIGLAISDELRFLAHPRETIPANKDSIKRISEIVEAIQILAHSPLIGRRVKAGKRELVIGRASRGYVALYRYAADIDAVFVLALRSQRESGCKRRRG